MGNGKRQWKADRDWSKVKFSNECKVVIGENNRVYVWRNPGEEWRPECLSPGCVPKLSSMIWGVFPGSVKEQFKLLREISINKPT